MTNDASATDERIGALVDAVFYNEPCTSSRLVFELGWPNLTVHRILRECEQMGLLVRERGAVRTGAPGRPTDLWRLG